MKGTAIKNQPPRPNVNDRVMLADATGEHDEIVTPELLDKHNLEYTKEPFHPLTQRENELMCYGEGFSLAGGAYCRFVRMFLSNGVKYINISDDDQYSANEGAERLKTFNANKAAAKSVISEIAEAFDAEFIFDDSIENEYWADVFIPMSALSHIKDAQELETYFSERLYLNTTDKK